MPPPRPLDGVFKRLYRLGRAQASGRGRGVRHEFNQRRAEAAQLLRWVEAKDRDAAGVPAGVYPPDGVPAAAAVRALAVLTWELKLSEGSPRFYAFLLRTAAAAPEWGAWTLRCMAASTVVDPHIVGAVRRRLIMGGEHGRTGAFDAQRSSDGKDGQEAPPCVASVLSCHSAGAALPAWAFTHALREAVLPRCSLDRIAQVLRSAADAARAAVAADPAAAAGWVEEFWDSAEVNAACRHFANRLDRGERARRVTSLVHLLEFMAAYPRPLDTPGRCVWLKDQACVVQGSTRDDELLLRMVGVDCAVTAPRNPDLVRAYTPLALLDRQLAEGSLLDGFDEAWRRELALYYAGDRPGGAFIEARDAFAALGRLGHTAPLPGHARGYERRYFATYDPRACTSSTDGPLWVYLVDLAGRGALPERVGVWWLMHLTLDIGDPHAAPDALRNSLSAWMFALTERRDFEATVPTGFTHHESTWVPV
eukprot:TRINITY_DN12917_c0_g1_i1.p1 TRINITY_DN12917_c0_g1~~TRINITY_DN12917_c0_g1_i1.p1  ORF type:complete len:479 (+),score=119.40 TRINITY_DN12917_c0_g1_i1:158-1594(+)